MAADTEADRPLAQASTPPNSEHRDAHDADSNAGLKRDPSDEDAKLDVALDETFPTSDPPSNTQPGRGSDPAPSSGFKEPAAPPPLDGE